MELAKDVRKLKKGVKSYVLLSCRSLGNAGTLFDPRMRRTPAQVIFSRVAQDLSHRVRIHVSLTKTAHSSHLAQHVARAFVVVTFTTEHYLTHFPVSPLALQSGPLPVYQPDLY